MCARNVSECFGTTGSIGGGAGGGGGIAGREGGGGRGSAMAKPAWMVQKEREDTVAADAKAARSSSAGLRGPLGVLGRASSEGAACPARAIPTPRDVTRA